MPEDRFSRREGYSGGQREIIYRADVPPEVREKLLFVLLHDANYGARELRPIVCRTLRVFATEEDALDQVQRIWFQDEWYHLYDIFEAVYDDIRRHDAKIVTDFEVDDEGHRKPVMARDHAGQYEKALNQTLREQGVGWMMVEGRMRPRSGSDAQDVAVARAPAALANSGFSTAANELAEALRDISRRPNPDRSGTVTHALAALEATARAVSGSTRTLGEIAQANPAGLFPPPLHTAAEKVYGYASGHARHMAEGREPSFEDAELVLGLSAALATYLARKHHRP